MEQSIIIEKTTIQEITRIFETLFLEQHCKMLKILQENTHTPVKEEFLSKKESAKLLGVHISTINRRIEKGELKAYTTGGRVIIKRTDLINSLVEITPHPNST